MTGTAPADSCPKSRTLNTGFEVEPDKLLVHQMSHYCSAQGTDDYLASDQVNPSLVASDTTYCFRDFTMDKKLRLASLSASGDKVVRIFVERNLAMTKGAKFVGSSGAALGTNPSTEMQAAFYTLGTNVRLEANPAGSTDLSKFYLYAPNATCSPGEVPDNPATPGIDESDQRSRSIYAGAIVCDTVKLDHAFQVVNDPPFSGLVEFGAAGFGSDLYPNNLWFVNKESIEFVPRTEDGW